MQVWEVALEGFLKGVMPKSGTIFKNIYWKKKTREIQFHELFLLPLVNSARFLLHYFFHYYSTMEKEITPLFPSAKIVGSSKISVNL